MSEASSHHTLRKASMGSYLRRAVGLSVARQIKRPSVGADIAVYPTVIEQLEPRCLLSAVSFQAQQSYPTQNYPDAVATADLGNGHRDLVVANGSSGTISVLLGNGDGTFQAQTTYPVGTDPDAVAIADLGNGHPDIVVTNFFSNTVSVFLGNGDGTFQPQQTYATGQAPDAVAIADLGSGHLDVLVANSGDKTLGVLLGNGDGTLRAQNTFAVGSTPDSIAVGQFSNGVVGAVVANRDDNTVSVLLGNGNGSFLTQEVYATGKSPNSVAMADLGNGQLDIVVANDGSNTVSVLLGSANDLFGAQQTYPTGNLPYAVALADLGNGHPDIVVINESDNTVGVLLGNGDGTFGAQTTYPTEFGPVAVTVADLGNGSPDIVTTNSSSNTVSVLLAGTGSAATVMTLDSSPNPSASGATITFSVTVGASGALPTGFITLFNGTTEVSAPVGLANGGATIAVSSLPAGTDSITAQYSGDATYAANVSDPLGQVVNTSAAQNLTASLTGTVPPTVVLGTPLKLKEKLKLLAASGPVHGVAKANVLLSSSESASDSVLTLASPKSKLSLKMGKAKSLNLKLPKTIPTTVAAGTYHVLIQLTDTTGVVATVDSGQSVVVAAQEIDLSGAFTVVPTTVKAGEKTKFTFVITNTTQANVAAVGTLPFAIGSSPDGLPSDTSLLGTSKRHINLKPGKSMKITLSGTFKSTTYLLINLDPNAMTFKDDVNLANNNFVTPHAITVG